MAKYVPPHLRRQAAEAAAAAEAGEAPASKPDFEDEGDRRMRNGFDNRGRDRDDGGRKGGGGKGGGDRFSERDRPQGNSRFDCLKEDFGGGKGGGGFGGKGGNNGDHRRSDYDRNDNGGGGGGSGDWFHRRDGRRNNGWDTPSERAVFGERTTTGINFDDYDKIPVKVSGQHEVEYDALERFDEAGLCRPLQVNLGRCGYDRPTPVQKHAIPIVCNGRDVMACAQTGSGKTCAYMVPAVEMLLRWGPPPMPPSSRRTAAPCALVMAPTRELATQIFEEGRKFSYNTGVRCCVVYGGTDVREQRRELNNGCDVLVATPGRLIDIFDRGLVTLSLIQFLILDEADRMLDMGFEPQVRQIVMKTDMGEHAPRDRQSMMFSATFAREVQRMASDFLHDYIFLTIGRVGSASELVEQSVVYADEREKERTLDDILRTERPPEGLALVFVETKKGADSLERNLWQSGLPVTAIHGDRSQHEREEALSAFRRGANPILIATDVAARGLDIPNVHLVVNYDMAKQIDDYVHRIGRTGRAGRNGKAIAFVNDKTGNSLLRDLRDILEESGGEVPDWFEGLCRQGRYGGGGGGSRKGGGKGNRNNSNRFGGRDARFESDWRGGGGGGGGGGGYPRGGGDRGGGGGRRDDDW